MVDKSSYRVKKKGSFLIHKIPIGVVRCLKIVFLTLKRPRGGGGGIKTWPV